MWGNHIGTAVFIRLCQFHVIQALLRWMQDVGSKSDPNPSDPLSTIEGPAVPFAIPKDLRQDILVHFRVLQRCQNAEDWDDTVETFKAELQDQCDQYQLQDHKVESLIAFFDRNWFVPEWRGVWIFAEIMLSLLLRVSARLFYRYWTTLWCQSR